ncbi:glycosyltransferase family 39 protein [uncultured Phycicoccus sp.]|uniref:ArnT family glycosyltransferase n=1 Tax=uncultured Phycicoccus sp. TaxID=661422 RepID=UPI00261B7005|nr:glycosyltransferase family 39 protein [uncultured Phycicoccus sp.]
MTPEARTAVLRRYLPPGVADRRARLPVAFTAARVRAVRPAAEALARRVLPLTGILVLALALRVWRLDAVGFNSDEAVYAGQAASITGDPESLPFFPVFRAHPLLFHTTVSVVFEVFGVSDLAARLTSVAFGVGGVVVAYLIGKELYGRTTGLLGALLVAVMPYWVIVSRQVLLDGPQSFLAGLSIWALARFVNRRSTGWLFTSAVFLGLSVLAKETSIILGGSVFAFFALSPGLRLGARRLAGACLVFVAVVAAYPLSLRLAGAASTGGAFITYQLFRRPNHGLEFYPLVVPPALGVGVVVAALALAVLTWRRATWRETLLWCWVVVPVAFFELFPVKGYQYLLPAAVPIAVLAARALLTWPRWWADRRGPVHRGVPRLVVLAVLLGSLAPTVGALTGTERDTALAGTGGLPGGRELGAWIQENVPEGVTMMTIGPSMANIIKWYGGRQSLGLSVSPNPLYRNPVYDPIPNPDLAIRRNQVQYVVWDSFSADRSSFFSDSVMRYVERYNGREVHRQEIERTDDSGEPTRVPVIIVYEVRP